jgi:hypothetical protein
MTTHLFMSYRSTESSFALQLVNDLNAAGITVWMDQLDGIRVGDDWIETLQTNLDRASGLLAAVSPAYVRSKYCLRELQRADTRSIPIFPLLIEPITQSELPLEIQRLQHLDLTGWQNPSAYAAQFAKLIAALKGGAGVKAVSPQPPPPRQPPPPIRTLEDQIEAAIQQANVYRERRGTAAERNIARTADRLNNELGLLEEQYSAAVNQFNIELSDANRVILKRSIAHFEKKIEEIETELEKLGR